MTSLAKNEYIAAAQDSGLQKSVSGSGGGGVDAIARAAAAAAQTNINAITPQANEVVPPGGVLYTSEGAFENATAGAITLGATNPPTAASLQADGLTAQQAGSTETGTNIPVAVAAFVDAEAPTIPELNTWKTANVGAGLLFPITQHPDDLYIYDSPAGKKYTYRQGDGQGAGMALTGIYDPDTGGGYEHIIQNAIVPLVPSPTPNVLRDYTITATTPTSVVDTQTVVSFPVPNPTATSQPFEVNRNTAVMLHLDGNISNDPTGVFVNIDQRTVKLTPDGTTGWRLTW